MHTRKCSSDANNRFSILVINVKAAVESLYSVYIQMIYFLKELNGKTGSIKSTQSMQLHKVLS